MLLDVGQKNAAYFFCSCFNISSDSLLSYDFWKRQGLNLMVWTFLNNPPSADRMKTSFTLNGQNITVEAPEDANLLWTLRERLQLTGTKYGCGAALCGACTVHLDGNPVRACVIPLSMVADKSVTTIEGLNGEHPLQQAWIEAQVPQCGYCQSGQIMQAAALLAGNPNPSRDQIISHMNGNICRCGTYTRILQAIESVIQER